MNEQLIGVVDHVLDLLEESFNPLVPFTGNLEEMAEAADAKREKLVRAAMRGLYQNVPGLKMRRHLNLTGD